ncbi:hypothetical protein V8E36_003477 [Tilletia maclaganii]
MPQAARLMERVFRFVSGGWARHTAPVSPQSPPPGSASRRARSKTARRHWATAHARVSDSDVDVVGTMQVTHLCTTLCSLCLLARSGKPMLNVASISLTSTLSSSPHRRHIRLPRWIPSRRNIVSRVSDCPRSPSNTVCPTTSPVRQLSSVLSPHSRVLERLASSPLQSTPRAPRRSRSSVARGGCFRIFRHGRHAPVWSLRTPGSGGGGGGSSGVFSSTGSPFAKAADNIFGGGGGGAGEYDTGWWCSIGARLRTVLRLLLRCMGMDGVVVRRRGVSAALVHSGAGAGSSAAAPAGGQGNGAGGVGLGQQLSDAIFGW